MSARAWFLLPFLAASVFGSAATSPRLSDIQGRSHEPLQLGDRKVAVIIFSLPDCPIAAAFAPEINRLVTDYTPRSVAFYLVQVERGLTPAAAQKHAAEFGYQCPVLLDPDQVLVQRLGATITPEAVVVGSGGRTLYQGRISDLFADLGQRRQAVTQHDLRAALDAVLAGKPVLRPQTKPVGCFIQPVAKSP